MIVFEGEERILDADCSKFGKEVLDEKKLYEEKKTLWVREDSANNSIPVRYEYKRYDVRSSVLKSHFYIDYLSYAREIDDSSTFGIIEGKLYHTQFCCQIN